MHLRWMAAWQPMLAKWWVDAPGPLLKLLKEYYYEVVEVMYISFNPGVYNYSVSYISDSVEVLVLNKSL